MVAADLQAVSIQSFPVEQDERGERGLAGSRI